MNALDGHWMVRREAGLLPPFGVRKFIAGDHGWTLLGGIPLAPFRVRGMDLLYRFWPIRDEVFLRDGQWAGRGYVFGKKFAEFRLEPRRASQRLHLFRGRLRAA